MACHPARDRDPSEQACRKYRPLRKTRRAGANSQASDPERELELKNQKQPKGVDVDDAQLEKLTLQELRDFREDVITAIRSAIRAKNQSLQPKPFQAHGAEPAAPPPALSLTDLERERDAWLSAKRQPMA